MTNDSRWRLQKAAAKGRQIDRLFEAACAACGINPQAAMLGSPLLTLAMETAAMDMTWTVLQTVPRNENRVCDRLMWQGFQTYAPRFRSPNHGGARLFPGYVFVFIGENWFDLFSTPGVLRVLMVGDRPAHLPKSVIRDLRLREDQQGFVRLPRRHLKPGQPVRIIAGSLLGRCGIHEASSSYERIRILIELLGRKVSVTLPEASVEPITTACAFG